MFFYIYIYITKSAVALTKLRHSHLYLSNEICEVVIGEDWCKKIAFISSQGEQKQPKHES